MSKKGYEFYNEGWSEFCAGSIFSDFTPVYDGNHCGDPDCEMCGELDPKAAKGYCEKITAREMLDDLMRGGKTCIAIADVEGEVRPINKVVMYFKSKEGGTIQVDGTEVSIKQVLVTDRWTNKNSGNKVFAALIVVDYKRRYDEHDNLF